MTSATASPEMLRAFKDPLMVEDDAPGFAIPGSERAAEQCLSGALKSITVSELLHFLAMHRKSGKLTLRRRQGSGLIAGHEFKKIASISNTCLACHGGAGEGGLGTAIAGSAIATGDPAAHLSLVLNGKPGTAMAAYRDILSDADLAAVLTYQRNAFGNDAGIIQPAAVKAAR